MFLSLQPLPLNAVDRAVANIAVNTNAIVALVLPGTTAVAAVSKMEHMLIDGNIPNSDTSIGRHDHMQAQKDDRRW